MRILRICKIIKFFKPLNKLLNSIILCLPSLLNVTGLLVLFSYIFSILFSFLFQNLTYKDDEGFNFLFKIIYSFVYKRLVIVGKRIFCVI